jgi:hypothetical protein
VKETTRWQIPDHRDRKRNPRQQGHDLHEGHPELSAVWILGGDDRDLRGARPPVRQRRRAEPAGQRDAIKRYSNWPTIPQVYVDGKFIGGCDIVREMHAAAS